MSDTPLDTVLSRLHGVKRERSGFVALCPGHDDHNPSLAISQGSDGRVLLHCRAGCDTASVLRAMNLTMSDIMPPSDGPSRTTPRPTTDRPRVAPTEGDSFDTAEQAVAAYAPSLGQPHERWTYTDVAGEAIGYALRWNLPARKTFRPVWRINGRWWLTSPECDRPLYNLGELGSGGLVIVAEGERCADLLTEMGFVATTSSGGANASTKTNWGPLAGRDVVIIPDTDKAGEQYASNVASLLGALQPPASVRIVRLPGLTVGEDVVEFVSRIHGGDCEAAATAIRNSAAAVVAADPTPSRGVMLADIIDDPASLRPPDTLPSGCDWFDDKQPYGAIALGRIVALAGEPGSGKTRLLLSLAKGFAGRGARVAWLLGEMDPASLWRRMLCSEAGLGEHALGNALPEHVNAFRDARERLRTSAANLCFVPSPINFDALREAGGWADVVFVDPLQAVRHPDRRLHRFDQIEDSMALLVELAGSGTVFLLSSTIAKGSTDTPRDIHSAFKGSSAIEQYAFAAYCADRPKPHNGTRLLRQDIRCLKQRDGAMVDLDVVIEPSCHAVRNGGSRD